MDYGSIILGKNIGAVLHITYHSSTLKTHGTNSALLLLEKCKKLGIDFYCASFKDKTSALYETEDALIKNGAIRLFNISDEAAYAKLLLCYNLKNIDKSRFMENNIYFESLKK